MWGFSIPMVQRLSRHLPFTFSKKYISGPILVKLRIKQYQVQKGRGCMCCCFCWLDWNCGIYRRIMGKTIKSSLKRRDPQLIDLCLGSFMLFLSCFCYAFVRVCLLMPCGHLLGKSWPLGSRLWCLIVKLSLSHWYPGSGVVLDCINSWSLPFFLLCGHLHKSCHPCYSHGVISWIKMGENFKKSSLKPWDPQLVVHKICQPCILGLSKKKGKYLRSSKIFYWPFQGGTSFVDLLCFCSVLCLLCFVHICLYVLCGHLLGKGWPLCSRLWCLRWVCHFPIGILGQVWYLIVSIPDLCTITYF